MSRSRHFRRILAAGVVASVSITWGAGIAFAHEDHSTSSGGIDQSNSTGVEQSGLCDSNEPNTVSVPPGEGGPPPECGGVADANTGDNAQVTGGQANLTGQADLSVATGASHHEERMTTDAFSLGLIFAIAIGGDATAGAANWASSDNDLTITNTMTTGDAVGGNSVDVTGSQLNSNSGDDLAIGLGSGVASVSQSNDLGVAADQNSAFANSGGNVQATGGQLNLTGQLALAGAQGSPGIALALGVGVAAGGDAAASAGNVSTHTCCGDPDNFNNFQNVTNDMTTGSATAVNSVQVGKPAVKDDPSTPDVDESAAAEPFTQMNDNTGNAFTLVGDALISFAGSFVVQSNTIEVLPSANVALANSGYNLQASGPQLNGNLQLAGAGAGGGPAGAVGLLGLALAFGGDAAAAAANSADSGNSQSVSNTLVTGDATAQNFTGVVATQTNTNSGNAGAASLFALIGIGVGGIVQYNGVYVESVLNTAEATTGYNAQVGGFQGNGTIQGAGAIAGGGWAGALGAFALAKAGDATAAASNLAGSKNDSHVSNSLETGDAKASNIVNLDVTQSNTNSGWAAGATALDLFGVGVGFVYQGNALIDEGDSNYAYADSGANIQGTLGQGNLTLQGGIALAGGGDAVSVGLLAGAGAGDASAAAGNTATSSNSQKVDNKMTTGAATALNVNVVNADQSNTNNGEEHQGNAIGLAALVYAGIGIGAIVQDNYVSISGSDNTAIANTGYNAQFSGPQVNITGQLALAGAQGGGALSLALLGAGAFGGDAAAAAANIADSTNWQLVCNDLITGIATAINSIALTTSQTNTNAGNAAGLVLADQPVLAAGAISQSNAVQVVADGNVAVANSGDNIQADGGQANVTVQVAADASQGGGSGALALGGAVAADGDALSSAANSATSDNITVANNDMTTGDATAINQTQVDVTQENHNEGDATAVGL